MLTGIFPIIGLLAQVSGNLFTGFDEDGKFYETWIDTSVVVNAIDVQSNGNAVIAASYFVNDDFDQSKMIILSMDENGDYVPFGNSPRGFTYFPEVTRVNTTDVFVLPDDKILVAGNYELFPYVARLLPNGMPDEEFADDGFFIDLTTQMKVSQMGVHFTGTSYIIYLSGKNAALYPQVISVSQGGAINSTFGDDGIVALEDYTDCKTKLFVDSSNDRLFLFGGNSALDSTFIACYHLPDGSLIEDFGSGGIVNYADFTGQIRALVPDNDAITITAMGSYLHADNDFDIFAYQINSSDGSPVSSFGVSGWSSLRSAGSNDYISDALLQPDGKYIFGGYTDYNGSLYDFLIGRMNSSGFLDNTFGIDGMVTTNFMQGETVSGLALSPGKDVLYATGSISHPGGMSMAIAAYHTGYETVTGESVAKENNNSFNLFPNPFSGYVTLKASAYGSYRVEVSDIGGRKLKEFDFQGESIDLNLEELNPSCYIIKVTGSGKRIWNSLAVKR